MEKLTPDISGLPPITFAEGYYSFAVNCHFGGLNCDVVVRQHTVRCHAHRSDITLGLFVLYHFIQPFKEVYADRIEGHAFLVVRVDVFERP